MKISLKCSIVSGVIGVAFLFPFRGALRADAAERIRLEYKQTEIVLDLQELASLAQNREVSISLQKALGETFKIPPALEDLLTLPVKIPPSVNQLLEGSTGLFLMEKLDTYVGNRALNTTQNVNALTSSLQAALADDGYVSFLELMRRYPHQEIQVNLTELEGTVKKFSHFLAQMRPTLSFAEGIIKSRLCKCNTAHILTPDQDLTLRPSASADFQASLSVNCSNVTPSNVTPSFPESTATSDLVPFQ